MANSPPPPKGEHKIFNKLIFNENEFLLLEFNIQ